MTTTFDKFSKVKILVVGDLMLDRYWWGQVDRISPEAPVPIVRLSRTTVTVGGAANVAANIAGLGAKAILLGIVGNDDEAGELERKLAESPNIERLTVALDDRKTTVKTRVVAHDQHVVRLDQEDTHPISEEQSARIVERAREVLSQVDAVLISDYAKGMLTVGLLAELISETRRAGKYIFVDPKGRDFSKYSGASVITPNLHEAADACGLEHSDPKLVSHAGAAMLHDHSLAGVLITEGANGMTLFNADGRSDHLDAEARKVYDVTGAGDTVIATFAVGAASGMSFLDAARLANTAAGIAVGQVGTAVVTLDQLGFAISRKTAS